MVESNVTDGANVVNNEEEEKKSEEVEVVAD